MGKEKGKGKDYGYKRFFEEEHVNGKRWNGKGKEYDYDAHLEFEIEYLNGEKRKIK